MSTCQSVGRAILGAIVVAVTAAGSAQEKTAGKEPQWLMVTITKLNPGVTAAYIDLQTKEVMPAQKKGTPRAYATAPGR